MANPHQLPDGLELVRTTPEFDQDTVPAGLLKAHRVADGVWGLVVIRSGSVTFVFEDTPEDDSASIHLGEEDTQPIPPGRLHHLELLGPVTFVVEFYKAP